jgi:hypothetical protein
MNDPFGFVSTQVLNYSARGGLSVMTDKMAHLSRLLVARADAKDSGNYTCVPSGAHPASVIVHVLNGESCVTFMATPLCRLLFWPTSNS